MDIKAFLDVLLLAILLQLVAIAAGNAIHRWNFTYIQPSGASMLVGAVFGGIVRAAHPEFSTAFSGDVFYYGLLPPIV